MDDYKKAQRGQHNYATKSNKSGERRAAFDRNTNDEIEDQMTPVSGSTSVQENQEFINLPEMLPRETSLALPDQRAVINDIYTATNKRWELYQLMIENLMTVQYDNGAAEFERFIDRNLEKREFKIFLDDVREAFRKIPEFRESSFWLRQENVKSRTHYNLKLMVKRKLIEYLNANGANIKWIA